MKKVWKKPKLVSIYRAQSYEAVLRACKNVDNTGDPDNNAIGCQKDVGAFGCECCDDCNIS